MFTFDRVKTTKHPKTNLKLCKMDKKIFYTFIISLQDSAHTVLVLPENRFPSKISPFVSYGVIFTSNKCC